jgi:hypothetical protein
MITAFITATEVNIIRMEMSVLNFIVNPPYLSKSQWERGAD